MPRTRVHFVGDRVGGHILVKQRRPKMTTWRARCIHCGHISILNASRPRPFGCYSCYLKAVPRLPRLCKYCGENNAVKFGRVASCCMSCDRAKLRYGMCRCGLIKRGPRFYNQPHIAAKPIKGRCLGNHARV